MARTATAPADFPSRLEAQDVSLFRDVKSQTKKGDRASLLALQAACAERFGAFAYLEIGSHLGGSLQPFVRDPRVTSIVSIDLRPEVTPDDRGKGIPYTGNSTQRMLDNLAAIPDADLDKIHTIDADSRTLSAADVPVRPELCFIDGEHTYESCLADARFCAGVVASDGVIAFHDSGIIFTAIAAFLGELRTRGVPHVAYPVPSSVFVIELGDVGLHDRAPVRRLLAGPHNDLPPLGAFLARRVADTPARRLALRLWLSELGVGGRLLERRRKDLQKAAKGQKRRLGKSLKVGRRRLDKRVQRGFRRQVRPRLDRLTRR